MYVSALLAGVNRTIALFIQSPDVSGGGAEANCLTEVRNLIIKSNISLTDLSESPPDSYNYKYKM